VINEAVVRDGKPFPPESLAEMKILPGVPEALKELRAAGFRLIVVTNQPDVAKGTQRREVVDAMNRFLAKWLDLDAVKVCYHVDADACTCRKPKPGMLLEAAREWSIDLARSYMVGDRWRDIAAGKAAGCRTVLVESGYDERAAENPDVIVGSLLEASEVIVAAATYGNAA